MLADLRRTPAHDAALDEAAADDVDLAWRVAIRRAERGLHDEAAVADLLARDPDPDCAGAGRGRDGRASRRRRRRPRRGTSSSRSARSRPATRPSTSRKAFWRPAQRELLLPWADRLPRGDGDRVRRAAVHLSMVRVDVPDRRHDEAFVARSVEVAEAPGTDPTVRGALLAGADTLSRMLRARSA